MIREKKMTRKQAERAITRCATLDELRAAEQKIKTAKVVNKNVWNKFKQKATRLEAAGAT